MVQVRFTHNISVTTPYVFNSNSPSDEPVPDEKSSSFIDQRVRLVTDQPSNFARRDHFAEPPGSESHHKPAKNPFEEKYVPHYAATLEEFESPLRFKPDELHEIDEKLR